MSEKPKSDSFISRWTGRLFSRVSTTDPQNQDQLIQVSQAATQRYNARIREALQDTVWAGDCLSWYKRPDGEISSLYPYNARTYLKDHRHLVKADFELQAIS